MTSLTSSELLCTQICSSKRYADHHRAAHPILTLFLVVGGILRTPHGRPIDGLHARDAEGEHPSKPPDRHPDRHQVLRYPRPRQVD